MAQPRTDVLIAGGGPAGLAAAIALAERGARVIVLEPRMAETLPRAEMLPPAAEPIIARLGISEVLDRSIALGPALGLWTKARPEVLSHVMGLQLPAISIDRRGLDRLLRARAEALDVEIRTLRFCGLSGREGGWCVAAGGGATTYEFRARFLIDATGRPAQVARRLGAQLIFGLPLVAQTSHVTPQLAPRLVIEAMTSGWWYALPLKDGGTIGFVAAPRTVPEAPTMLPEAGKMQANSNIWDARNTQLLPCTGPGWIATGDASAAFDPIASQGLFNALSGGFFAGNAAADALAGKRSALGAYAALVARTAKRTHGATPNHYATAHSKSHFWQRRSEPGPADWIGNLGALTRAAKQGHRVFDQTALN